MPKENKGYKIWCVGTFPVKLRNRFVGQCKSDGKTVGEVLEYLTSRYLREREKQEQFQNEKGENDKG